MGCQCDAGWRARMATKCGRAKSLRAWRGSTLSGGFHRNASGRVLDLHPDSLLERQGVRSCPLAQGVLGSRAAPRWSDRLLATEGDAEACRYSRLDACGACATTTVGRAGHA